MWPVEAHHVQAHTSWSTQRRWPSFSSHAGPWEAEWQAPMRVRHRQRQAIGDHMQQVQAMDEAEAKQLTKGAATISHHK